MKAIFIIPVVFSVFLFSCKDPEQSVTPLENHTDSLAVDSTKGTVKLKKANELSGEPGAIGVFEVPEMLTLCRKDSAATSKMAVTFAKNYSILEKDLAYLGIKSSGSAGSIYYNNDTSNFIFECVFPIAGMPKKTPKKSTIVVLEASPMLIYNHYGEYADLHVAYDNVRKYLAMNELVQAGPLREFYITNPDVVTDHSKWLTRLMVPVMKKK
ncbi:MAG: GyrI-like domain-containing protein [Bacteroidetes bacterium]|nr:GyrI-like domain-containing protein [Bacteroidota bacterium]